MMLKFLPINSEDIALSTRIPTESIFRVYITQA